MPGSTCTLYMNLIYTTYTYRIYELKEILLLACTVVLNVYISVHVQNLLSEGHLITLCTVVLHVYMSAHVQNLLSEDYLACCMYSCTTCVYVCTCTEFMK